MGDFQTKAQERKSLSVLILAACAPLLDGTQAAPDAKLAAKESARLRTASREYRPKL
jgi:hypothetical protein